MQFIPSTWATLGRRRQRRRQGRPVQHLRRHPGRRRTTCAPTAGTCPPRPAWTAAVLSYNHSAALPGDRAGLGDGLPRRRVGGAGQPAAGGRRRDQGAAADQSGRPAEAGEQAQHVTDVGDALGIPTPSGLEQRARHAPRPAPAASATPELHASQPGHQPDADRRSVQQPAVSRPAASRTPRPHGQRPPPPGRPPQRLGHRGHGSAAPSSGRRRQPPSRPPASRARRRRARRESGSASTSAPASCAPLTPPATGRQPAGAAGWKIGLRDRPTPRAVRHPADRRVHATGQLPGRRAATGCRCRTASTPTTAWSTCTRSPWIRRSPRRCASAPGSWPPSCWPPAWTRTGARCSSSPTCPSTRSCPGCWSA